ncbi:MAG: ClC family H(+)/Cl(-) exchange transporter [Atopobiaceae bacterium]|jgi:H+/Cl- antiporter ClcA|nr:ClC family H(+)/Cl(-) exchange transporter [Atopobiaceae bacterium]MCI2207220.1 ClC family H(+)/Cl(-) exchange transporter [Atopobiaceae bacterium]
MSSRFQVNMVWEGALVGLIGGAIVTLYRLALSGAEWLLRQIIAYCTGDVMRVALWVVALLGILLVIGRLMLWEPYSVGSGIPQVDAEVMGKLDMPWHRVMASKFAEGTLLSLAGLSLGREGPAVQLGGMAGKAVSKGLSRGRGEERLLVTCGAGAGMAAAFHAPLTGVMFALEEIHKTFSAPLIISVMSSCIVADFLVSQVIGIKPVLAFHFASDIPHIDYWVLLIMGVVMGGLGAIHNVGMFASQAIYDKIKRGVPYLRLAVPFAVAAVIAFTAPDLLCGGDAIVELLESGKLYPIGFLLALLIGKYLFTTVSFGSGAPGGTLFPLVVMGALAGSIFGTIAVNGLNLSSGYITNFMVLGIAGLFAGVVRSPVTAIVLVFELTGSFDALLSLSIVSIVAYVTANLLKVDAFYEYLVARLLGLHEEDDKTPWTDDEKVLKTHVVEVGSYLVNKSIAEVDWPDSVLVVTVTRCGKDTVARGSLRFQALDRVMLIMDAECEDEAERKISSYCRGILGREGR